MPINIIMPALTPTMEKGNLAKWLKKEGDKIAPGDVIAEIETDKATMEVEAADEGVLAKIVVPEGTADVPVNELIAVLAGEGEDVKAAASAAKGGAKPAEAKAAPARGGGETAAKPTASAAAPAPQRAESTAPPPQQAAAPTRSAEGARTNGGGRIFASPLARRLAKGAGIDVSRVQGSGPHGRIVARDIAAAREGKGLAPAPAQREAAPAPLPAPSDEKIRALFPSDSYEVVPHDNMRKIIAQRLQQAKQTIPHFYLTIDCDIGKLT